MYKYERTRDAQSRDIDTTAASLDHTYTVTADE